MKKVLRIECSNGEVWEVPAEVIAKDRADHYKEAGTDWQKAFDATMEDDYELKDWAVGNMDWADVAPHAVQVRGPKDLDMQEEWLSCGKKVAERN